MKKVGKYITISLLLLLGLCCVCVLYLFFIPNSSLFNITYISKRHNIISQEYNSSTVETIVINSRAYDLEVLPTETDNIYVKMESTSFGFVLNENKTPSITPIMSGKVLTFDIKEPYGFTIKNNSSIKLYVPDEWKFNLEINNNSSYVEIDDEKININNLTYSTESGRLVIDKASLDGYLNLNLNNGRMYLGETVATAGNNTMLKVKSGRLHADYATLGNITIKENDRGVIVVKQCADIIQEIETAGGRIEIDTIEQARITTSDTNLQFGTVNHGALITLTSAGKVKIENIYGESSAIVTNSGNINIEKVSSPVLIESDTGNITINNAYSTVSVKANYGEAIVNFAEDADEYTPLNKSRVLYATIKNGKLTASGVEHIGKTTESLGIKVTGNGRVNISMKNVLGENEVQSQNGEIKVIVEKTSEYKLTTKTISGNVRVNLTQTAEYNGYTTKDERVTAVNHNASDTSSNSLTVTTEKGDLLILDTNFA